MAYKTVYDEMGLCGDVVLETEQGLFVDYSYVEPEEMRYLQHGNYYVDDGWQVGDRVKSLAFLINGKYLCFNINRVESISRRMFEAHYNGGLRCPFRLEVLHGTLEGKLCENGWSGIFKSGDKVYMIKNGMSNGFIWLTDDSEDEESDWDDFDNIEIDEKDLPPTAEEWRTANRYRERKLAEAWLNIVRELLKDMTKEEAEQWLAREEVRPEASEPRRRNQLDVFRSEVEKRFGTRAI